MIALFLYKKHIFIVRLLVMKYSVTLLLLFFQIVAFCQKDSLRLGTRYWEDQLYISVTYNVLNKQLEGLGGNAFSYGLSAGYIKDIPFNKKGKWATGVGIGYNYDSFSHGLRVFEDGNITTESVSSNKIRLHNIEFPIQLRWRNSDAVTYSFWRIYAGVRLNYNFSNIFKYTFNNQNYKFSDIPIYNNFQTGLELSVGYGTFNFYMYYGLAPMYKNVYINKKSVDTRIAKFGLIFYLL